MADGKAGAEMTELYDQENVNRTLFPWTSCQLMVG